MANLAELDTKVGADTSTYHREMDQLPGAADQTVDQVESKFEQLGPKLAEAGKAAGVAAGTALIIGAVEAMDREAGRGKLAARINLDPAEQEAAGRIAGSVYANAYGESLGQVNEAVEGVITGLADLGDTAGVERLTSKALDVAAAFERDVGGAVQEAKILISSGLVPDADAAFDVIVAGAHAVSPALRDELGEAATEYSEFFGQIGMDGEQMYGMLSQADDQFEMDKIGDSIKELTIRGTDMSDASVAAFDAAGLSASVMANSFAEGGDKAAWAFDRTVEGLLGIEDPVERANAAVALFGTPIEDLGVQKIPQFLESLTATSDVLGDVEGRAASMGDTLNDNATVKVAEAQRAVEGFLVSIVETDGPIGDLATGAAGLGMALKPVAPAIAGVGFLFRDQLGSMASTLGSKTGSMISSGAKWASSLVTQGARGAAGVAQSAGVIIGTYTKLAVQSAVQGAKTVAATAASTGKMIGHYAKLGVQSLIHAAKVAASWVIAMGPVGWAIAAAVAVVTAIVLNWDKVVAFTKKAWSWVSEKVSGAARAVVGFVKGMGDKVVAGVRWLKDTAVALVRGWVDLQITLATKLRDKVVGAVTWLADKVVGAVRGLKDGAVKIFRAWVQWHIDAANKLRDTVVGAVTGLRDRVVGAFGSLKDGAIAAGRQLMGWVTGIPGRITSGLGNLGTLLVDKGKDVITGLWDGIRSMGSWLAGKITGFVTDKIPGPIARALGIASPSKVAHDLGAAVPAGLAEGVLAGESKVVAAAEDIARAAAQGPDVPDSPAALFDFHDPAGGADDFDDWFPKGGGSAPITVIMELDGREIGRTVTDTNAREIRVRGAVRR